MPTCYNVFLSSASNFCVWKSFQRRSLKIHLLFIERVSVGDGTIDAQRKMGQDRQGKEHVETEMQAGTRRDETAQSSKPKTQMLVAFFAAGAIWICALQPLPSKPQQGVTLSALLPGSSTPSRPLYLLQGLYFNLISHTQPVFLVFLLCAYRRSTRCSSSRAFFAPSHTLVSSARGIWTAFHRTY